MQKQIYDQLVNLQQSINYYKDQIEKIEKYLMESETEKEMVNNNILWERAEIKQFTIEFNNNRILKIKKLLTLDELNVILKARLRNLKNLLLDYENSFNNLLAGL